jgi:hypothetical protein
MININVNVKAQQHPQNHHMPQSTSNQQMNANGNPKNMIYMNNTNGTSGGSINNSNGHMNKYSSGNCTVDQHPSYYNDVSIFVLSLSLCIYNIYHTFINL